MSAQAIVRAEAGATLRRPLLVVIAAVFFFLAFQTMSITSPTASGVIHIGRLWHNSPYVVARLTAALSVVALFAAALLIAPAVQRDFQHRAHPFFLMLPITRADYLLGRFTGAFTATLAVWIGAMAGVIAAALTIPPEFTGPHRLLALLQPLLLFALPNLLLAGAICFAVATLSRSMLAVYVTAVVLMMILGIGQSMVDEALQKGMVHGAWAYAGALAEPFGAAALQLVTAAWSPAEKNLRAIPIAGFLLVHRAVWMGIATGVLAFTVRRFRLEEKERPRPAGWDGSVPLPLSLRRDAAMPAGGMPAFRAYVALTLRELRLTVGHLAFVVLALATLANLNSNFLGNVRGQQVYPRTGFFLQNALNDSAIVIVLTLFFAGVMVWRERGHRTHEIVDSQPVPNAVLFGSKLSALLLMQVAYAMLVIAYGVFVQLVLYRYTHLEPGVYFAAVFGVKLLGWWAVAILMILLQALAPNVYAGYAMSAATIGASYVVPLGAAGGLLRVGYAPDYLYSDMNGFGHYVAPLVAYRLYWLFVSIALVIVTAMAWRRGNTRGRATPRLRAALAAIFVAAIGTATVIVANTPRSNEAHLAAYETKYRRFRGIPQPIAEAVDLAADFYPRDRRLHLRGTMTLRNAGGAPIESVHVTLLAPAKLELDRRVSRTSRDDGYSIFTLAAPLAPGDAATLRYDYDLVAPGFSNDGRLVRNGSVIVGNDPESFPQIGYQSKLEISDPAARRRYGLPPAVAVAKTRTPHWSGFHAIVSTDAEQLPVATGERVRERTSGGRHIAEYATTNVVGTLFMLASGKYERAAARGVEVLYHRDHPYNLRSMLAGVQCGIDYGSEHFAPYPQKTLRVVELPAYTIHGNAQALTGVIVWGESGGFVTDVARDPNVDRVFSTAAHEAGHQWWGNSALVLNEVLSDDVRVSCVRKSFGEERAVAFLRDMRWNYFRSRDLARDSGRPEPERSLRDGGQYDSGYILMWRLRHLLGDDSVNAALHDVVAQFGYRTDRAPSPADVADALRRHAPPALHPLIADVFDHITLHPLHARSARAVRLSDGHYQVTVSADLQKTHAAGDALPQPAPLGGYRDWIDVGVYGDDGRLLSFTTQPVTDPRRELVITVAAPPARVVLDPLCTLLDADPSDNEVAISR